MDYQTAKKVHSSKDYREFNQDPTFLFVNQFMKKGKDFDADLQKQFLQVIGCVITKKKVDEKCQEVYDWVKSNNLLDTIIDFVRSNREKAIWYSDEKEVHRHIQELNSLPLFLQSFNPTNSINRDIFDKIQNVDSITKLNEVIEDVAKISTDTVYKMYFDTQTTRIIEDIFNSHDIVTPTLIDEKGVDFFINKVPLDLKITHIPKGFDRNFKKEKLIKNLYEKQGTMRFCAENRLFLILHDSKQPEMSDKIRITHYQEIKKTINDYLDTFREENLQDIEFVFEKKTYTAKSDIISVVI